MLGQRSRLLYSVGQRLCSQVQKQWKATAAAASDVNPFYFQDILEPEKKRDVEWKKLTGIDMKNLGTGKKLSFSIILNNVVSQQSNASESFSPGKISDLI